MSPIRWTFVVAVLAVLQSPIATGRIVSAQEPAAGEDATSPRVSPERSRRAPVRGQWSPTVLPPNDLVDPPVNYKRCRGGACVGMSGVIYALWCSPVAQGTLTATDCAARVIHTMVPQVDGRYVNHPLPSHVLIDGKPLPVDDQKALVRIAEIVQTTIHPDGGRPTPPAKVREFFASAHQWQPRLDTSDRLKRHLEAAGGRLVAGLLDFGPDLQTMSGHAAIFSLGRDGNVYVWDPNAKMAEGAAGSGRLVPLKIVPNAAGRIERVEYAVTLPDGRVQRRKFGFVFPIPVFITAERMPPRPR